MHTQFDWSSFLIAAAPPSAAPTTAAPAGPSVGPAPAVNPADAIRGTVPSTTAPGGTTGPGGGGGQAPGMSPLLWMLPLFLLFFIVMNAMAGRKDRKKREQMLSAMKRNDRVLTAGGIIGTVADIRDDEVHLKIDDNSNVKIKVLRSSIQQVLRSSDETPTGSAPAVEVKSRSERDRVNA